MSKYTLKPGHQRTFFLGVPRRFGEQFDVPEPKRLTKEQQATLDAHFNCCDANKVDQTAEKAEPKSTKPKLRNGLTEEQARQKLQGAGVTFTDDVSGDQLADLFDKVFSNTPNGKK